MRAALVSFMIGFSFSGNAMTLEHTLGDLFHSLINGADIPANVRFQDPCCDLRLVDGTCAQVNPVCQCSCYNRAADGSCHHCSCKDGGKSCN